MQLKDKLVLCGMVAATVIVVLLAWGFIAPRISHSAPSGSFTSGAAGNLLIEQYDPYVGLNGGINSALPVTLSNGQTLSGNLSNTGTLTQGTSGTALTRVNSGQCFFAPAATTITASTTIGIDCQATAAVGASGESALTGVTLGDNVVIELSTTTAQLSATLGRGLQVVGASASTTSGYITVRLSNVTGTTFTWPTTGTASGTASYIVTK